MDVNGIGQTLFNIHSLKVIHYSTILRNHQGRKYWLLYLTKTLLSSHNCVSKENGNK